MLEVSFAPITLAHLQDIASDFRAEDLEEVRVFGFRSGIDALIESARASEVAGVGIVEGRARAAFGVSRGDILSGSAHPWMLGTEYLKSHPIQVLRASRTIVAAMKDRYPRLNNYVHAEYTEAVQWIRWLGFEMGEVDGRVRRFSWSAC